MSSPCLTLLALSILPSCFGLSIIDPGAEDSPRGDFTIGPITDRFGEDTGTPGDSDSGTPDTDPGDTDPGDTGSDTGLDPDTGGPGTDSPLAGLRFWVDPDSNAAAEAANASADEAVLWNKIADHSVAKWLGGWSGDVENTVARVVDAAETEGSVMSFVVYNLPNRDCGGYSSGGAANQGDYQAWIDGIAAGLGGRTAVVILEPDGLSMMDCLSSREAGERFAMLSYATNTLTAAGAFVYIDAGHSAWHPVDEMAGLLVEAGVSEAAGFALNTSNFEHTADLLSYGENLSRGTGGAHFVSDTSRNGLGPTASHEWCNPAGRALGLPPTTDSGHPLADALLWVKAPGESDGSCNGGPAAGKWWREYALGLARRAAW